MLAGRSAISPETNNWLTLGNEIAHSQNRKKTALLKELPAALNELDQGDFFFFFPQQIPSLLLIDHTRAYLEHTA
jgi:hypothetical protein